MSAVDLLPCPFCGGVSLRFTHYDIDGWISHVECLDCDDMLGPMSAYKYDTKAEAEVDAAEVWNRRSPAPASAGKVKALQFEGHNGFWRADDGIGGFFEVTEVGGAFHMCRIVHGHANKLIPYQSREAAFAACQADHDRRILAQLQPGDGWLPIVSAPKDGTSVDLWHRVYGRRADHYWGHSDHCCGEAGQYCDSEWHSEPEGWIDSTFNEAASDAEDFTHWMPLPAPPASLPQGEGKA